MAKKRGRKLPDKVQQELNHVVSEADRRPFEALVKEIDRIFDDYVKNDLARRIGSPRLHGYTVR